MSPMHTLHVATEYDDGDTAEWYSDGLPGTASEAHDRLHRRWEANGVAHVVDRDSLTITVRYEPPAREVAYTERITHIPRERTGPSG